MNFRDLFFPKKLSSLFLNALMWFGIVFALSVLLCGITFIAGIPNTFLDGPFANWFNIIIPYVVVVPIIFMFLYYLSYFLIGFVKRFSKKHNQ